MIGFQVLKEMRGGEALKVVPFLLCAFSSFTLELEVPFRYILLLSFMIKYIFNKL